MVRLITFLLIVIPSILYAAVYEIVEPDFVETAKAFAQTEEFKELAIKEQNRQIDMGVEPGGIAGGQARPGQGPLERAHQVQVGDIRGVPLFFKSDSDFIHRISSLQKGPARRSSGIPGRSPA